MGLFRRYDAPSGSRSGATRVDKKPESPQPAATSDHVAHHGHQAPRKKDAPTPTRRQAEAARMQRVNPKMSPKEAKKAASRANREQRMAAMEAAHSTPEKTLMRDMVDSRLNPGEFLLPAMLIFLAMSFLQNVWSGMAVMSLVLMYGYILVVAVDLFLLWRRYKRVHAERIGGSLKGKGALMYGCNRSIQMRRLRVPAPRLKRGDRF